MNIELGNKTFEGPYPITNWNPPCKAAIYAIMIKENPQNQPDVFTIIYFGKSNNLSDKIFYNSHPKFNCWFKQAGSKYNIYIGIYKMANSIPQQRRAVKSVLINQYNPICNY